MIRLSIIVPFYNVEKYIEKCIRSLYDQDIPQEEYEVLCVDDCSPDGSMAIVERLQKGYPTLRLLVHTENKRQGGARNTGLREAKGKYVWFVDSDDYIMPNCLKALLDQAERENLDILQFFNTVDGVPPQMMIDYGICTGSQYVFDAPLDERPVFRCCVVWRCIIRRELLLNNNLWFAENVQYEDDDYAYMMFAKAKRVHLIPLAAYTLRTRRDSTTHGAYNLQMARYYSLQVGRFIRIEPTLSAIDRRWEALIQEIVRWTCRGMILEYMHKLAPEERSEFYSLKTGNIPGLHKWVSLRTWLAMRYEVFYKKWFAKK